MRTSRILSCIVQRTAHHDETLLALGARHTGPRSCHRFTADSILRSFISRRIGSARELRTISAKSHDTHDDTVTSWKHPMAIAAATLLTSSWLLYNRKPSIFLMGELTKTELGIANHPQDENQQNTETAPGHDINAPENPPAEDSSSRIHDLPVEKAPLTTAPHVPPHIERDYPVLLQVSLETTTKLTQLTNNHKYSQWTFNNTVPGPFIRSRVGDTLELALTNRDDTGNPHNIDCHAVLGPGGGAALTTVSEGETKTARFKLQCPGLYMYHCAAAPVPVHIANGMYGLILVQPEHDALAPVDREYYVMQSEFYHEPPEKLDDGKPSPIVEFSYPNALREEPDVVVFNGHEAALTRDSPLKARVDETVRIYFGNAGPNLTSSFHVIGANFNRVYRDADVISPPAQFLQTVLVPPGGATIVDMKMVVPGTYTLVDHAIFRLEKGAVGYLNVSGEKRPEVYQSAELDPPAPCVGCKLHP
ncbi:Cupredoxin [Aspergillus heterothallicus]